MIGVDNVARNKRDHHLGHLVDRKDVFASRVMLGYKKNANGRTVANRVLVKAKSKTELTRKVAELRRAFEQEGQSVAPKISIKDLCEEWKRHHRLSGVRASTQDNYDYMVDCHIVPKFGQVMVHEIKAQDIQSFLHEKILDGRFDKKGGLSSCTVNRIYCVLHLLFEFAIDREYLSRSPLTKVRKIKSEKKGVRFLSDDQIGRLMAAMADFRMRYLFHFILATGTRRGEALGLTWRDVDPENQQVLIRQALVKDKNAIVKIGSLKKETAARQIPLTKEDFAVLMEWKKLQDEEKALLGPAYQDNGLVFCRVEGQPIYPDTPGEWLEEYCAAANIERFKLHELRHTYASRMIRAGTHPKVIQELLGHTKITVTMDTYGHLFPGMKREAVDKASPVLQKPKQDETKGETARDQEDISPAKNGAESGPVNSEQKSG